MGEVRGENSEEQRRHGKRKGRGVAFIVQVSDSPRQFSARADLEAMTFSHSFSRRTQSRRVFSGGLCWWASGRRTFRGLQRAFLRRLPSLLALHSLAATLP